MCLPRPACTLALLVHSGVTLVQEGSTSLPGDGLTYGEGGGPLSQETVWSAVTTRLDARVIKSKEHCLLSGRDARGRLQEALSPSTS